MMRFRVMAWLSALVVLAGCVASNVEESISKAADGLVVEHNCEAWSYGDPSPIETMSFRLFPTGLPLLPIRILKDEQKIVVNYTRFDYGPTQCEYVIDFENMILDDQNGSNLIGVTAPFDRMSAAETEAIQSKIMSCEQLSLIQQSRRYRLTGSYYSERFHGIINEDVFLGCAFLIQNRSNAFNINIGSSTFRVSLIFDQLITERLN